MKDVFVLIYDGSPFNGESNYLSFIAEDEEEINCLLRLAEKNGYVAVVDFRGDDVDG